ncbi:MAG: phosphotransferase [Gemmatimonas sp.]
MNPTNLVFDGTRVMLLDWQTIAPNHPHYDLATAAMFFRFDEETSQKLLGIYHGVPVDALPQTFRYYRRLAAVLSGSAALRMARLRGHAGGDVAVDAALSLGDVYQLLRSGSFDISSASGQWTFGLALVKEGIAH